MAAQRPVQGYSRFIRLVTILLPLFGLVMLSLLFLLVRNTYSEDAIPYAELEEIIEGQKLVGPEISGVTTDDVIYRVVIGEVLPEDGDLKRSTFSDFDLSLQDGTGQSVSVTAPEGSLDVDALMITVEGLTRIETSTGYMMESHGLAADLEHGRLQSLGALEVRAPMGRFTAGSVEIDAAESGALKLDFQGGVKLVYQP